MSGKNLAFGVPDLAAKIGGKVSNPRSPQLSALVPSSCGDALKSALDAFPGCKVPGFSDFCRFEAV